LVKKILVGLLLWTAIAQAQLDGNYKFHAWGGQADTLRWIHEYKGTVDTVQKLNVYGMDTSIAYTGWGIGVHNITLCWFFNGYNEWYCDFYTPIDNTTSGGGSGGSGSGAHAVNVLALDTTGADSTRTGVSINLKDIGTGTVLWSARTGSSGIGSFNLDPDTFLMTASSPGGFYNWPTNDTLFVTGAMTDTIRGYSTVVGTPDSAHLCRVYGWIYNAAGSAIEAVNIEATLRPTAIKDTCSNVTIMATRKTATTNSSGYWYMDLLKNKCTNPQTEYSWTAKSGMINISKMLTVPDSVTYRYIPK
jgi:hypothetical protein